MFCCTSKDDGGSPVKKTKKVPVAAQVEDNAVKDAGLIIISIVPV